jgi:signal transduction histidine kinase
VQRWHGEPGHRHSRRHGPRRWRGPRGSGPLRRGRDDRLAGGVASGLAARTGLDVSVVRIGFVVATLASGFGAAAYVLAWLLMPAAGQDRSIGSKALADRRGLALAAGLVSLLVLVLLIVSALGASWVGTVAWPLLVSVAGLTLIWRNGPPEEQEVVRRLAQPLLGMAGGGGRARSVLRIAVAVILLAGGLAALLAGHRTIAALLPLAGVALVIAAFVVVLGPWWLRIARDLVVERQARARAEERADMAARVHDSVLQTLALIQRRASDPQQVIQLARAQERELRSWLFDGRAPGSLAGEVTTLAAGVRLIQQEVEAQHGISVEAVTVGDCELDDDLAALLAAGREATVNAAKWSGAPVVSLFAEVEPGEVSLFVRDRGRGFDPQAVPADRKGLAESVRARMTRHGGSAAVRSAAGEGTEVALQMKSPRGFRPASPAQRSAT